MNDIEKFLGDEFELVDVLKSAATGFVVLARDKKNRRLCVVK